LINLARQLGGSLGIAVLGSYLTRHIAYHRADLAQYMHPGNPPFSSATMAWSRRSSRTADRSSTRSRRALGMLDAHDDAAGLHAGLQRRVELLLISFICVVPAVFLLRRPHARAAASKRPTRTERYAGPRPATGVTTRKSRMTPPVHGTGDPLMRAGSNGVLSAIFNAVAPSSVLLRRGRVSQAARRDPRCPGW
jgi:hypothetical protein